MTERPYAALGRPAKGLPRFFMDCGWYRHPDYADAPIEALFLMEAAIGYCTQHALDGHMPADPEALSLALGVRLSWVRKGLPWLLEGLGNGSKWERISVRTNEKGKQFGSELVIRGYVDHNPTSEEIADYSENRRKRGTKGNHTRWHINAGQPRSDCEYCIAAGIAKGSQEGSQAATPNGSQNGSHGMGWDGMGTSPTPHRNQGSQHEAGPGADAPAEEGNTGQADQPPWTAQRIEDAAWDHIGQAELANARRAGTEIRQPDKWLAATLPALRELHGAAITHQAERHTHVTDLPLDELAVVVAQMVDPKWEPLDGGRARAERAHAEALARNAEADRRRAVLATERTAVDEAMAALDPDRLAEIEAQERTRLGDDASPVLIRHAVRSAVKSLHPETFPQA